MNPSTDWVSALAILASGLVLGLLFVFFYKGRKVQTLGGEDDLERKDLEAKRDALLQQLRDPELSPTERTRLELETAAAMRALDTHNVQSAVRAPSSTAASTAMNPLIKGYLWGAGSVGVLAALAFFVSQSTSPREEGGVPTGGITPPMAQQQAQTAAQNPMVAQLEAAVRAQPENMQLRNDLAQAYLESDNMMGVFEQTKVVLQSNPNDSRALTFQGLVRMAMGEVPAATTMITQATKSDPKNLDAWVALAWLYMQQNKVADAEKMIAEAAKVSPADKPRLDEVFLAMKRQASQQQQASASPQGELPAGHPPVQPTTPAPAQTASGERSIRVTIDLDPSAKSKTGILFVMARNPQGGPPAAVKRMTVTQFPITFDLGSADSMMGQPLPDSFRLEARLDSDGDPLTKPATDPSASQEAVTPGTQVRLALR